MPARTRALAASQDHHTQWGGGGGITDLAPLEAAIMQREGKRDGSEVRFLCPGHKDHHPSARWNPEKQAWFCDVCGEGGSLKDLAERLGVDLGEGYGAPRKPYTPATPKHKPVSDGKEPSGMTLDRYAEAKRLDVDELKAWGLATTPNPYIATLPAVKIPYLDENGEELAVRFRVSPDTKPKLIWKRGSKTALYGLWRRDVAREGYAILVEGESDSHTGWHYGLPVLGAPGANTPKPEWAKHLEAAEKVYLVQEPGEAGAQFAAKVAAMPGLADKLFVITLEGAKDLSELHLQDPEHFMERWQATRDAAKPYAEIEQALEAAWGDLRDLPPTTPEVPTLPAWMIPEPLRAWIADAAKRACVHLEYIAVAAIVTAGAVIGRSIGIHPKQKDDWIEVPNLWGAIVGPPSWKKSMALDEGNEHVRRLAAEARQAFEDAEAGREADMEVVKLELAQLKGAAKGKKGDPAGARAQLIRLTQELKDLEKADSEKRYLTNDSTIEKLGELLKDNPRGLLVMHDELTGWLRSFEKPGHETDRAFYLKAWNGKNSASIDRIGRGSLYVPAVTASVLGGIQPTRLLSFTYDSLDPTKGADGLLQRFQMIVWPDRPPDFELIDEWPDTEAKNQAYAIYQKLDQLEPEKLGVVEGPLTDSSVGSVKPIPALRFSCEDKAQELFYAWYSELMKRTLSPELECAPAFQAHLAKYPSLFASLALIFHSIDLVAGKTKAGPISFGAASLALQWCAFLEAHAKKIYAPELNTAVVSAHELAGKIKQGEIADNTAVRDIQRRQWAGLKTAEQLENAIKVLEECAWLRRERVEPGDQGGRPSEMLRLHPELRGNDG